MKFIRITPDIGRKWRTRSLIFLSLIVDDSGIISFPDQGPVTLCCEECDNSFFFVNTQHERIWMECGYCRECYPLVGEFPDDS